jgi:hypothetical protein
LVSIDRKATNGNSLFSDAKEADNKRFIANSFPTFLNFPSSTNFLRGAWIVEFTVDLGELSALCVLIFEPFGCTFLHKGGGATPDNYKRFEKNMSTMWKKNRINHMFNRLMNLYQYLWHNRKVLLIFLNLPDHFWNYKNCDLVK